MLIYRIYQLSGNTTIDNEEIKLLKEIIKRFDFNYYEIFLASLYYSKFRVTKSAIKKYIYKLENPILLLKAIRYYIFAKKNDFKNRFIKNCKILSNFQNLIEKKIIESKAHKKYYKHDNNCKKILRIENIYKAILKNRNFKCDNLQIEINKLLDKKLLLRCKDCNKAKIILLQHLITNPYYKLNYLDITSKLKENFKDPLPSQDKYFSIILII